MKCHRYVLLKGKLLKWLIKQKWIFITRKGTVWQLFAAEFSVNV